MSNELFDMGPAVYVPIILVSLIITLLAYCIFPLIFAKARKKVITKKKYRVLCYCFNFIIMVLFIAINGKSSGTPYVLWTSVFSALGIRILKNRCVLDGYQTSNCVTVAIPSSDSDSIADKYEIPEKALAEAEEFHVPVEALTEAEELHVSEETCPIRYCRKCGFKLSEDSNFCSRCGTDVKNE